MSTNSIPTKPISNFYGGTSAFAKPAIAPNSMPKISGYDYDFECEEARLISDYDARCKAGKERLNQLAEEYEAARKVINSDIEFNNRIYRELIETRDKRIELKRQYAEFEKKNFELRNDIYKNEDTLKKLMQKSTVVATIMNGKVGSVNDTSNKKRRQE